MPAFRFRLHHTLPYPDARSARREYHGERWDDCRRSVRELDSQRRSLFLETLRSGKIRERRPMAFERRIGALRRWHRELFRCEADLRTVVWTQSKQLRTWHVHGAR